MYDTIDVLLATYEPALKSMLCTSQAVINYSFPAPMLDVILYKRVREQHLPTLFCMLLNYASDKKQSIFIITPVRV